MRIGILQTGHAPDEIRPALGDYGNMFERLLSGRGFDFTFEIFSVVDMAFPSGPEAADGWLITGSRHGVYEDHPWLPPLEQLVRDIVASGRPLVGICFGHQLIAKALGGEVVKYPGGWAVGRQIYDFNGEDVALNAWHQDQVVQAPPGAEVIASNPFCANAAMLIGDNVMTLQPHPEYDAEVMAALMTYRGGAVPPDLLAAARAQLTDATENEALAGQMAAFLARSAA